MSRGPAFTSHEQPGAMASACPSHATARSPREPQGALRPASQAIRLAIRLPERSHIERYPSRLDQDPLRWRLLSRTPASPDAAPEEGRRCRAFGRQSSRWSRVAGAERRAGSAGIAGEARKHGATTFMSEPPRSVKAHKEAFTEWSERRPTDVPEFRTVP